MVSYRSISRFPGQLLLTGIFWLFTLFITSCQAQQSETYHQSTRTEHSHKRHHKQPKQLTKASEQAIQTGIPAKVYTALAYIRANGRAPEGYVGGRRFGNFENHLPRQSTDGKSINYQEWDVNPKVQGQNRGAERLITGSDGRAYYTSDHYNSFTELK